MMTERLGLRTCPPRNVADSLQRARRVAEPVHEPVRHLDSRSLDEQDLGDEDPPVPGTTQSEAKAVTAVADERGCDHITFATSAPETTLGRPLPGDAEDPSVWA